MFCQKCGSPLPDDSVYCQSCGYKVLNENIDQTSNLVPPDAPTTSNTPLVEWYYYEGNDCKGPISIDQIQTLINNSTIRRGTLVWKEGMPDWQKIEFSDLNCFISRVAPPIPQSQISDKWLWALASVPFINIVLTLFINNYMGYIDPFLPTLIIILALNITFLTMDLKYLERNGIFIEKWLWCGIILIPIYLFVRASKTTKNIAPGVIWIILELLCLLV